MASTLRKLADKLEGKDKEHDNVHSSNFGPHSSAAANKVDPFVDSDRDGRNDPNSRVGGLGNTQTTTSHTNPGIVGTSGHHTNTTTGPHNSDLANKLDPRVDSTQLTHAGGYGTSHVTSHTTAGTGGLGSTTTTSHHSQNTGPHNSNLANKLDPRVDSDRDGRNDTTSHVGGYGNTQTSTGVLHGNTYTNTGLGEDPRSTNSGPHSSNFANKLDPRVDSDRDGRQNPSSHVGGYGTTQTATSGYGDTHTGTGNVGNNPHSTNTGPHSSNLLNKLDPRVDSDLDGRSNPTSHTGGYGHANTTVHEPSLGTHGTTGTQGYTGSNTAHNDPRSTNTGPHSSNLLNKLDPRVDSDRDGRNDPTSRTGGFGNTQTGTGNIGRY